MAKLNLAGFTFTGRSVAGVGTTMAVKELKLCFDLGLLTPEALSCNHVFLSHAHTDHAGALFNYLAVRALEHRNLATIFVPPDMGSRLPAILNDWQDMAKSRFEYRIVRMFPGAPVPFKNNLTVTAVPLSHEPQTVGYLVEETVTKLKEEHKDLPPQRIAALKGEGRGDLFYQVIRPLVAYVSDTLPEGLDQLPDQVWQSKVLALEATFLDERKPLEKVRKGRHLVLDDILERLGRFEGEHLLLFHFSKLYTDDEIRSIVATRFPDDWKGRVHCFL